MSTHSSSPRCTCYPRSLSVLLACASVLLSGQCGHPVPRLTPLPCEVTQRFRSQRSQHVVWVSISGTGPPYVGMPAYSQSSACVLYSCVRTSSKLCFCVCLCKVMPVFVCVSNVNPCLTRFHHSKCVVGSFNPAWSMGQLKVSTLCLWGLTKKHKNIFNCLVFSILIGSLV